MSHPIVHYCGHLSQLLLILLNPARLVFPLASEMLSFSLLLFVVEVVISTVGVVITVGL